MEERSLEEKNNTNKQVIDLNSKESKDLISSIFLIAFCIFVIVSSLRMRVYSTFYDAPGIFPLVISSITGLYSIFLLIDSIKKGGFREIKSLWEHKKKFIDKSILVLKRIIIISGLIFIYALFLVQNMHFTIATFIFLSVMMSFLKINRLVIILISGSLSLVISFAFGTLFNIPLP